MGWLSGLGAREFKKKNKNKKNQEMEQARHHEKDKNTRGLFY